MVLMDTKARLVIRVLLDSKDFKVLLAHKVQKELMEKEGFKEVKDLLVLKVHKVHREILEKEDFKELKELHPLKEAKEHKVQQV